MNGATETKRGDRVTLICYVPAPFALRVREQAKAEGEMVSALIRRALRQYLDGTEEK